MIKLKKNNKQKGDDPKKDDLLSQIKGLSNIEKELKEAEIKLKEAEEKVHTAEIKTKEMEEAYKRALADLENFRRRTEEEKTEYIKYASKNLLLDILPCLDNFKKSLDFIPKDSKDAKWVQGITQSIKLFNLTLEKHGVQEIKSIGEKLDPNLHDALLQGPGAKDIIIDELEKGYTLNGKVIKHSKVKVGDGEK